MKRNNVRKIERLFDRKTEAAIYLVDFLMRYPTDSFTLSELAQKTGLAKSTVSRLIETLEKEKLILVGTLANLLRIKYNDQNLKAIGTKIGQNLIKVYQSEIIEYIIQKWGAPKAIILFGSYRKGEDTPQSDIDIAIEISDQKEMQIIKIDGLDDTTELKKYEQRMERKFRLMFYNKRRIDKNLLTNIQNGIVLYGVLENE